MILFFINMNTQMSNNILQNGPPFSIDNHQYIYNPEQRRIAKYKCFLPTRWPNPTWTRSRQSAGGALASSQSSSLSCLRPCGIEKKSVLIRWLMICGLDRAFPEGQGSENYITKNKKKGRWEWSKLLFTFQASALYIYIS